jgi:RNA polymerase sigma factor (TIGR02999 family)
MAAADRSALDEIYSLAYEELRGLARATLRGNRGATLTPTSLVNEVWIKLSSSPQLADTSPAHFRGIAGRAMRQVLIDSIRRKRAQQRGGGEMHVMFEDTMGGLIPSESVEDIMTLDAALTSLSKISPRQAQLVEGRFFGGLSWSESAEVTGISESTVMREWRAARAWLSLEIKARGSGFSKSGERSDN